MNKKSSENKQSYENKLLIDQIDGRILIIYFILMVFIFLIFCWTKGIDIAMIATVIYAILFYLFGNLFVAEKNDKVIKKSIQRTMLTYTTLIHMILIKINPKKYKN